MLVSYFQLWSPIASIPKQLIQFNWPLNHSHLGGAKRVRAFIERSKQLGEGISVGTKKGRRCKKMAGRRGLTVHWSPLFINDVFPRVIPHLVPYIHNMGEISYLIGKMIQSHIVKIVLGLIKKSFILDGEICWPDFVTLPSLSWELLKNHRAILSLNRWRHRTNHVTLTRYWSNFRPVENSPGQVFFSHGTTLTLRKSGRLAVQKFER